MKEKRKKNRQGEGKSLQPSVD